MSGLVVDVSVAVKWTVLEVHAPAALRLLNGGRGLIAPDLFGTELANALLKWVRRNEITIDHAIHRLQFSTSLVEILPSQRLTTRALELGLTHGLTAYDALYVALAMSEGCALVTADRNLYDRMAPADVVEMIWIEDIPEPADSDAATA